MTDRKVKLDINVERVSITSVPTLLLSSSFEARGRIKREALYSEVPIVSGNYRPIPTVDLESDQGPDKDFRNGSRWFRFTISPPSPVCHIAAEDGIWLELCYWTVYTPLSLSPGSGTRQPEQV